MSELPVRVHELPDDILYEIFALLTVECKQKVLQVTCKRWNRLLQAPPPGHTTWGNLTLNLDAHRHLLDRSRTTVRPSGEELCRWVSARTPGISSLTITGWLFGEEDNHPCKYNALRFLDYHFGFLAGALQAGGSKIHLAFSGGSVFQSTSFQNSAFISLLAPVVRRVSLVDLEAFVPEEHISILCQLTGLESLIIRSPEPRSLGGLMGLPDSISSLMHLRHLELENQIRVRSLPSGVAALSNLQSLAITGGTLSELPSHVRSLSGLTSLVVAYNHAPLHVPNDLSGLDRLVRLELSACGLSAIPSGVTSLSSLTAMDLRVNRLHCPEEDWCPPHMSNLGQLHSLRLSSCLIASVSPNLCTATQLIRLDLQSNHLEELPEMFGQLVNLEFLDLSANRLKLIPAPLTSLLRLRTLKLSWQRVAPCRFRVDKPLTFVADMPQLEALELSQTGSQAWDPVSLFHLGTAAALLNARRRMSGVAGPTLTYIHSAYGDAA